VNDYSIAQHKSTPTKLLSGKSVCSEYKPVLLLTPVFHAVEVRGEWFA